MGPLSHPQRPHASFHPPHSRTRTPTPLNTKTTPTNTYTPSNASPRTRITYRKNNPTFTIPPSRCPHNPPFQMPPQSALPDAPTIPPIPPLGAPTSIPTAPKCGRGGEALYSGLPKGVPRPLWGAIPAGE
ncbi:extensin-like [Penaeus chinensis]|uniref:extensin-like n=1 Tax=Penaeus chinensis TaxID=139456 RepID=UPI001FB578BB|nr:extensin-like [Penaeus chinensis]